MQLTRSQFLEVIARTPLVSIDLIIRDRRNRILLGRRANEPAKGKWFVPGGRIYKNETREVAFKRICTAEIEEIHSLSEGRFVGSFTHKYSTNVYLVEGITTHYVVLAFELRIADTFKFPKTTADDKQAQHTEFRWFAREDADPAFGEGADPDVHENVLPYFRDASQMKDEQYLALNARRDNFNTLLWQTPALSLTAQAFLFTIILSKDSTEQHRIFASFLAMIAALGSIQLLAKHRFMETQHAMLLQSHENAHTLYAANRAFRATNIFSRLSSYWAWMIVLSTFFLGAAAVSIAIVFCRSHCTGGWLQSFCRWFYA